VNRTTVRTFRKRNQFHILVYRTKILEFQSVQCSPRDASQKLGHRRSSEVPRVCAVTYFIRNNTPLIIYEMNIDQKRHKQHFTHNFVTQEGSHSWYAIFASSFIWRVNKFRMRWAGSITRMAEMKCVENVGEKFWRQDTTLKAWT
jgi:hypothetical protein